MSAKIKTIDIDGKVWEAEGDFVMGAVGKRQEGGGPNITVDFSKCTAEEISLVLATALILAGRIDKKIVMDAVVKADDELKI